MSGLGLLNPMPFAPRALDALITTCFERQRVGRCFPVRKYASSRCAVFDTLSTKLSGMCKGRANRHNNGSQPMSKSNAAARNISFRSASREDGADIWALVRQTGTLELNSAYFYLLFATDFGDHCLVAEHDGVIVGVVIGYRPPREPSAAFVWQIGVAPAAQATGLGLRMLQAWHRLPANHSATFVTATVASDNVASDRLFRALARSFGTNIEIREHFSSECFPEPHPPEPLYRIGPITALA